MSISTFKTFVTLLLLVTAVWSQRRMHPPWPPQEQAQEWEIVMDDDNTIIMKREFPYGTVDRLLTIYPGNANGTSVPEDGKVRYPNGFSREMKKGELTYFWEVAGAKQALEMYMKDKRGESQ
ncbi:MAG: hypothetical protein ACLFSB_09595 [Chitinispirillaceae bacterium]